MRGPVVAHVVGSDYSLGSALLSLRLTVRSFATGPVPLPSVATYVDPREGVACDALPCRPGSLPKDVLLKGCSCQIPVGLQSTKQRSYLLPPTPTVSLPSFVPFHRWA